MTCPNGYSHQDTESQGYCICAPRVRQRPTRKPRTNVELLPELAEQIRDLLQRDPTDVISLACADYIACRIEAALQEDKR